MGLETGLLGSDTWFSYVCVRMEEVRLSCYTEGTTLGTLGSGLLGSVVALACQFIHVHVTALSEVTYVMSSEAVTQRSIMSAHGAG